jgi:DEAD/DEAH box helicase domain-containing protein
MLRLSVVVVDEAHVLRGVFGSHVARWTLRRLRRLIAHHGGNPRWCLAERDRREPRASLPSG